MSRLPEDKVVRIVLVNGRSLHLYADMNCIQKLFDHPKFVKFRDDGNDNICFSIDAIAGFEVVDDRTDVSPATLQPTEGSPPMRELPE